MKMKSRLASVTMVVICLILALALLCYQFQNIVALNGLDTCSLGSTICDSSSNTNTNDHEPYVISTIFPNDVNPNDPTINLVILDNILKYLRVYYNDNTVLLHSSKIESFEIFSESNHETVTVYLRSYYSNEPIPAMHTQYTQIHFANKTSLNLTLYSMADVFYQAQKKNEYKNNNNNNDNKEKDKEKEKEKRYFKNMAKNVVVDFVITAEKRWAITSLITSSMFFASINNGNRENSINGNGIRIDRIDSIRIATVNLWNYNHWQLRFELLNEFFEKYKPDIIGFQELRMRCRYGVTSDGGYPSNDKELEHSFQIYDILNNIEYFKKNENKYNYYSEPAMFFKELTPEQAPQHVVGEGLALFVRRKVNDGSGRVINVINKHKLLLTRDENDAGDFHQRLLLGLTVEITKTTNDKTDDDVGSINTRRFNIFTSHLSLSNKARQRNLNDIGKYMTENMKENSENSENSIVMGDFNCEFDKELNSDRILHNKYNLRDVWKWKRKLLYLNKKNDNLEYNQCCNTNTKTNTKTKTKTNIFVQLLFECIADIKDSKDIDLECDSFSMIDNFNVNNVILNDGLTFNSWNMRKRIDYMFVNKEMIDQNKIIDIQVVGDNLYKNIKGIEPVGGVSKEDINDVLFASDHRFLIMDVKT